MNKMKQSMSVLLASALLVSALPSTALAVAPTLVNGTTVYSQTDTNKETRFVLSLGQFESLKQGTALFQLENAKLAAGAGANVSVVQGSTTIAASQVTLTKPDGSALTGAEQFFTLNVNNEVTTNNSNALQVVVTLGIDYSDQEGEAKLIIRDSGTGIGDSETVIATDVKPAAKDIDVRVANPDLKIGPAGGTLSNITILDLGKLDATTANNELSVRLPKGLIFSPATKVEIGSGTAAISYSSDKNELIIKNINDKTSYILITPFVLQEAKESAKQGAITAEIAAKVKGVAVSEKTAVIGQLVEYGLTVTAVEKGKKEIPTLTKGISKTVEVTINAVDGTLSNGQRLDLSVDGAAIVYGTLKVSEPSSTVLTAAKSAGTRDADKVSGYEVYSENDFALRTGSYGVKKIVLAFDVVAQPNADKVTLTTATSRVDDQVTELAKAVPALTAKAAVTATEKGTVANLSDITLTEAQMATLEKGDKIYLELNYVGSERDKGENVAFDDVKNIKVTTKNDLAIESVQFGKQENILELTVSSRAYNGAGSITLSGMKAMVTGKATNGEVKLSVTVNKSLEDSIHYFNIGTKVNKTVFTIGSKSYTTDGVIKTASAAPYIKGTGYTMLPVRALGEALGLSASWNNQTKTATFSNASKIAVVTIGDSHMIVNGTRIELNAPAEIVDGATMIELRSLANAFNTTLAWNGTDKTVTVG